jgi:hypothetical protein
VDPPVDDGRRHRGHRGHRRRDRDRGDGFIPAAGAGSRGGAEPSRAHAHRDALPHADAVRDRDAVRDAQPTAGDANQPADLQPDRHRQQLPHPLADADQHAHHHPDGDSDADRRLALTWSGPHLGERAGDPTGDRDDRGPERTASSTCCPVAWCRSAM